MNGNTTSNRQKGKAILARMAPGLGVLVAYQRKWLRHDLIAGVSVAAVALPTAIAYAQIIGLDPVIGLYAAIPALFTSPRGAVRQPDRRQRLSPARRRGRQEGGGIGPGLAGKGTFSPFRSVPDR